MWDINLDKINIYLIRHAATLGNTKGRYIGKTDESLCEKGKENIIRALNDNMYPNVNLVIVSPMKRCIETARLIYPTHKYIIIDELSEMDFGDFENKNYEELSGNKYYQKWIDSNGELPFPKGEVRQDFIERTMKGFRKTIEYVYKSDIYKKMDKAEKINIAMVVHGGTIMAITSSLYGCDYYKYQIKNGRTLIIENNN